MIVILNYSDLHKLTHFLSECEDEVLRGCGFVLDSKPPFFKIDAKWNCKGISRKII